MVCTTVTLLPATRLSSATTNIATNGRVAKNDHNSKPPSKSLRRTCGVKPECKIHWGKRCDDPDQTTNALVALVLVGQYFQDNMEKTTQHEDDDDTRRLQRRLHKV